MDYTDILEYLNKVEVHGSSENILGTKKRQLVLNEDDDVETFLRKFQSARTTPKNSRNSNSLETTEDDDDYSPEVLDVNDDSDREDMEIIGSDDSESMDQNGWNHVNDLINSYRDSKHNA